MAKLILGLGHQKRLELRKMAKLILGLGHQKRLDFACAHSK